MNNKKEVLQQIITLLSSLVEDEETNQVLPKPTKTRKKSRAKTPEEKPVVTTGRSKKTFKTNSKNRFETMDIRNMHKEDVEIDKLLSTGPPCPRTRGYTTIDVCCRSCGKKDSVSPILAGKEPSRYKCNTCATSGG